MVPPHGSATFDAPALAKVGGYLRVEGKLNAPKLAKN
jgi:hypothetical protein